MKGLDFRRYVLCSCVAAAMLAGCGSSQPPIGAPGAMPQSPAIATHAAHGKSWMLPEAKSEDLLYASSLDNDVFSYPKLKQVGDLKDVGGFGLCSNSQGDIFVPSYFGGPFVAEFAHGGTTPIETLALNSLDPVGCAVDPTTGNLAVTAHGFNSCQDYLGVFAGAQGSPTVYCTAPLIGWIGYCGYDDSGNLYIDGQVSISSRTFALVELAKDKQTLKSISIKQKMTDPGQVQWDGSYLTLEDELNPKIDAIEFSRSRGRVIRTTLLKGAKSAGQTWIQGDNIVVPYGVHTGSHKNVGVWKYPNGGKATFRVRRVAQVNGVTVSVAPSR